MVKRGRQGATQRGRRRKRRAESGAIALVRTARRAAKKALDTLRAEIASASSRLEELLSEERGFRLEFGSGAKREASTNGRRRAVRGAVQKPRRKGPPKADNFFKKLPAKFSLDDVRKLAGRLSGVSLAQWSRSGRITKTADGYQKTA